MNSDLYFGGKKYISSARAAKISGYVKDYIGQLCRDGKLECQMVGRSWYVSFESLVAHKNSNAVGTKNKSQIIALEPVTEQAPISPVDARLDVAPTIASLPKADEISSSQNLNTQVHVIPVVEKVTVASATPHKSEIISLVETLTEKSKSIEKKETVSSSVVRPKIKIVEDFYETDGIESFLPKLSKTPVQEKSFVVAPVETPVAEVAAEKLSLTLPEVSPVIYPLTHHAVFAKRFPMAIAGAIALLVAFIGFRFSLTLNPEVESAYFSLSNNVNQTVAMVFGENENQSQNNTASVLDGVKNTFDSAGLAVYQGVNSVLFNTSTKILAMLGVQNQSQTPLIVVPSDNLQPTQAMVVVPTTPQTDRNAVVTKIKNSFSDEVTVQPAADGSNGVITPIFKKTKGDDYLYVLVPIKN